MTTTNTGKLQLLPTQVPALPFAPVQYEQKYQDQFQRILTQYLNQNTNLTSQVVGTSGGRFISFPHIAAQDNANQYATATNTATKVLWSQLDSGLGFTLNPNSSATPEYTGVYKIDYSLQFTNTDTQIHDVYVWLHVDGYDVVGSGSRFSVPNSHGGVPGYLVAYSSLTFTANAGDPITLYWATNQAATSGGVAGVYMSYHAAQTVPPSAFAMPSTPSAVGTIAFVSAITT